MVAPVLSGSGVTTGDSLPDREVALEFYVKHEPLEILGRGLSSVVRRCVDRESGECYAVKIIDVSEGDNSPDEEGLGAIQEVHREINILKCVDGHSNIIRLVDTFETPTFIFLVFELCEEGELYDYLNGNVRLSEKRVRSYMKQILEAVLHCHRLGIVHRDLKPENLLLDDNFTKIKLTDFGLAKVLSPGERLYQVCGTPGYLAPEVLRSGMYENSHPLCTGYSFEVDAWACGIIMYTLLVGRPPFWDRNQLRMIRQICDGNHSFNGPEWDDITDETKDLIDKLLIKDPSKRLTIEGALKHDVFQRGHVFLSLVSGDGDEVVGDTDALPSSDSSSNSTVVSSRQPLEDLTNDIPQHPQVSGVRRAFNGLRAFRAVAQGVRFLVRLSRIKTTPELLSLRHTRINPYQMRSYRKKIDQWTFTLYHHWIKKGEGQNRAAMFQFTRKKEKKLNSIPETEEGHQPSGCNKS